MIGKRLEYQKMYDAERKLWWYRILHAKTIRVISHYNSNNQDIKLLDAGCGTGGMMESLRLAGFSTVIGFDASADAVEFSKSRGFTVFEHDLTQLADFQTSTKVDILICHDVLCYFDDTTIIALFEQVRDRLNPDGIFITNNNAHPVFSGAHDVVLGIKRRFTKKELQQLAHQAGLQVSYATYWSLFLSPLIALVRGFQRIAMKVGVLKPTVSDVSVPPVWLNQTFWAIVRLEEKLLKSAPFGSSIFMVFSRL